MTDEPPSPFRTTRCDIGGAAAVSRDLSIDEPSFRAHLRDVGAVQGLSAITINAHSTEVASCTDDEQRRVMEIAGEEVGGALPIIHGVDAHGSLQAARTGCDRRAPRSLRAITSVTTPVRS